MFGTGRWVARSVTALALSLLAPASLGSASFADEGRTDGRYDRSVRDAATALAEAGFGRPAVEATDVRVHTAATALAEAGFGRRLPIAMPVPAARAIQAAETLEGPSSSSVTWVPVAILSFVLAASIAACGVLWVRLRRMAEA